MTILEKLIAGGLEQTEAERMIADALRNALLAQSADAEPSDSSGGASAVTLEDKPETPPETQVEAVEAEESAASTEQEALDNSKAPVEPEAPEEAEMSAVPDTSALIANLMAAEIRGCALECGVDAKRLPVLIRLIAGAPGAFTDTSGIDPMAENLHEQVMTAVKAALKEVPELARSGAGSGSLYAPETAHLRKRYSGEDVAAKFRSGF